MRPSSKGVIENVIAWAILAIGAWLIHHFHFLSSRWNDLLIVACVALAFAVGFRFRVADRLRRKTKSAALPLLADASDKDEIAKIAPLFGTELRDIRSKIERWKSAMAYPQPYENLPAAVWAKHGESLASERAVYTAVERAYVAGHEVNQNVRGRVPQTTSGDPIMRVPPEPDADGLDRAHGLAGEALDALGERHNDPYQVPVATGRGPYGRYVAGEFQRAFESGLEAGPRRRAANVGERLTQFWQEREQSKPMKLDRFQVGSEAARQRAEARVAHEEETVSLYLIAYSQEAIDCVRELRRLGRGWSGRDEAMAADPSSTNDIATLAARMRSMGQRNAGAGGGTAEVVQRSDEMGELFDNLFPFLHRGIDILNRRRPGGDDELVDRATEKWIDGVRELAQGADPEFALHFTISANDGEPRHTGQSRRLHELVQRLSFFLGELTPLRITYASYGAGARTIDLRDRLNALISEDGCLDFIVDEATMGGDPTPGQEKRLILRWVQNGGERSSSFKVGSDVGLPVLDQPAP